MIRFNKTVVIVVFRKGEKCERERGDAKNKKNNTTRQSKARI
jgi:hypothetical protein